MTQKFEVPTVNTIVEEHTDLRAILSELRDAADPAGILEILDQLETLLQDHFVREEGPGGLAAVVDESASYKLRSLELLFAEHKQILAALRRCLANAKACVKEDPLAALQSEVCKLCDTIAWHERRETRLLQDSLYEDIGGG